MHIVSCVPFPSCHFFCLFHSTILYLTVKLIYSLSISLFLVLDNFFLSVSVYSMKFQASSLMYFCLWAIEKIDLSLVRSIIIICHLEYGALFLCFLFLFPCCFARSFTIRGHRKYLIPTSLWVYLYYSKQAYKMIKTPEVVSWDLGNTQNSSLTFAVFCEMKSNYEFHCVTQVVISVECVFGK